MMFGSPPLYRGVSTAKHGQTGGRLLPKAVGPFEYRFVHDGTIRHDGSATYGSSERNAILRHQLNQAGFPTAGVSTTPYLERAHFYATRGGRERGVIYAIERTRFAALGIREFRVAEHVTHPSIPEDDEVILVANDGGEISRETILDILEV